MAATDTLAGTKSLGNVRALASQARAHSGPAAEAITQLQQQQDKLLALTKTAVATLIETIPVPAPTPSTTPPGDVTGLTVSGSFDPISRFGTITVAVTPPAGLFDGCHLFIEIPDGSAATAFTVGTSDLSGTDSISGQWTPTDLERQPYVAAQQPWTVAFPIPAGLDVTAAIPCRLYAVSYTTAIENALVQAGQPGASPNQTFSLTPRVATAPASGTNVTQNTGPIVATVLAADNSTGKLKTPVYVIISSAPNTITGWVGQLVLTYGSADPTVLANQFPVGPIFTTAGPVNAGHDGILVPHSFAVDTPKSVVSATVWARTGLVDANGNYQWNNLVPGITPSFPITLGTTTGTIDAASILLASINSTMAVTASLFGVATNGIATINIQALAVTNPLLASLAVDAAKLATGAVTATKIGALAVGTAAIQLLAVDSTIIANASVSAAKIVNATITTTQIASATIVGANIASATILDANIATCNVTKLTSGTITAALIEVGIPGSGVITDITQAFDATFGASFGIQLRSSTTNNRVDLGFNPCYWIDNSNHVQLTLGQTNVFCGDGGTNSAVIVLNGTGPLIAINKSGTNIAMELDGSSHGQLIIEGSKVVSTRVATTPVTLADVIAVLQHHGLSN